MLLSVEEVPLCADVHFAYNPELSGTRSVLRPLSARETMSRAKAVAARMETPQSAACTGQIFIGTFFGGTGNNRDDDYVAVENTPLKHKHSRPRAAPLAEQSPHLVRLNPPSHGAAAWQWIARMAPRTPCVTVLAGPLSFDALFEQLKHFTEIRLPDDFDMFFGFWDPAILGTLVGQADDETLHVKGAVLDDAQRQMLFGGLTGWWYWDRNGGLHRIEVGTDTPAVKLPAPIMLSQAQVDALVEAGVPDHVLYFVDLNQPHLLTSVPVSERYDYTKRALRGAREIGLSGMMDLVNYVCMTLIFRAQWSNDERIANLLRRVKNKKLDFSDAIKLLPSSTVDK